MSERRYTDDEVRRILALTAEAEAAAETAADRPWTLAEVQRIGMEAGMAPQAVVAAAMALERPPVAEHEGRYLGLPVAVSRSVPLARHLSDEDWERLLGQLRETFAAEGRVRVAGARREWRVGNLRVTHEPAGSGALLELRTRKGDARAFLGLALVLLVLSVTSAVLAHAGSASEVAEARRLGVAWLTGIGALLTLAVGALRLPVWARRRARQFDALATYARRIAAS